MIKTVSFSDFHVFKNAKQNRHLLDITLELTARCNNNCNHCYNNLPEDDLDAIKKELTTKEVKDIIDQAFNLGVLRIILTGGEVLLREDFFDLYTYIKKKGFLVSIFTNATRISDNHVRLFKKYPLSSLEVTVYGASDKEYASVTKTKNFPLFKAGIDRLITESIPVTFKAMVLKSNVFCLNEISDFCKNISHADFRYDPFLTLRTDRNLEKNKKIIGERLSEDEIVELEKQDPIRFEAVKNKGLSIDKKKGSLNSPEKLFQCGIGKFSCFISYDGFFRLCRPLVNQRCVYDLRKGTLKEAWGKFAPNVLALTSEKKSYQDTCGTCKIRDLCKWCPASADLETGKLDEYVDYFCSQTKKRYEFCMNYVY